MSNIPVARRYARALLDVAGAQAEVVLQQLEAVSGLFVALPDLLAALSSPALTRAQRHALVDAVVKAVPGLHPGLVNTFKLLTDRTRFDSVPLIVRQYRDLVDGRVGRLRGQVTSAVALKPEQVEAIASSLKTLTKKDVVLAQKLDPSLLGGVVAQVGSTVYDGSLKSQLQDLAQSLARP
jgi:F-type H+-transporting ATPase subunit delta